MCAVDGACVCPPLPHRKAVSPTAASYRAQKTLEQVAYEGVSRAIMQNDNILWARIIPMGHLHIGGQD